MEFIATISHVIPCNLNHICEPYEKYDNFHFINGFSQGVDHKYVVI
jgi:hypothetical protein